MWSSYGGHMRRHILTECRPIQGDGETTLWEGTTKQPGEIGWLKEVLNDQRNWGRIKRLGIKWRGEWGGEGIYKWTRKQGVRERLHSSYPLPGKPLHGLARPAACGLARAWIKFSLAGRGGHGPDISFCGAVAGPRMLFCAGWVYISSPHCR